MDVLRGQVLGAVTAPLTAIIGLFTAPLQDLYGLLDARIEQLGGAAGSDQPVDENDDSPEAQPPDKEEQ